MTRTDIELMLTNLAETTQYLRESSRRMREAAAHIVTVADHLHAPASKGPPVTDVASLPTILTIKEVAAFYRISVGTMRRGLQAGTFAPRPWKTYPYRWRRDDIVADLKRPPDERPHKLHGFATTRRAKKA